MRFGRAVCGDLEGAERREWLLADGRGGYAMGTVAGTLTRRYHGLLVAALDPPVTRRLVVAKLELDAEYDGASFALATNRWVSGAVAPDGWTRLEAFAYDDGLPAWTYALGDALLEVTLAMPRGVDAVAVALRAVRARNAIALRGRLIVADRSPRRAAARSGRIRHRRVGRRGDDRASGLRPDAARLRRRRLAHRARERRVSRLLAFTRTRARARRRGRLPARAHARMEPRCGRRRGSGAQP